MAHEGLALRFLKLYAMAAFLGLVAACGGSGDVPEPQARPGDTDTTFASNGIYVHSRVPTASALHTHQILVIAPDRLLALGGIGGGPSDSSSYRASASFVLTGKGALDGTFGQEGLLPVATTSAHEFTTAQQLADGSLVLASKVPACSSPVNCVEDPGPTYRVQRYLSAGVLDTAYAQAGTYSAASHVGNAAILTDGTTISLGATYAHAFYPSVYRPFSFHAVVVDAAGRSDGTLAERFLVQMIRCSPSGTADVSSVSGRAAPVVQRAPDDRIIFAFGACMLKLNRDATPDSSFGVDGLSFVDNAGLPVQQVLTLGDGSILTFSVLADRKSYRVVKRLPDGSPDPTFGVGGVLAAMALPFQVWDPSAESTPGYVPNTRGFPGLDRHGRFLVAGYSVNADWSVWVTYLARFDAKMNLDGSFGSSGTGVTTLGSGGQGTLRPQTIAIDEMDRIVLGGYTFTRGTSPYDAKYAEAVTRLHGMGVAAEPVRATRPLTLAAPPFVSWSSTEP